MRAPAIALLAVAGCNQIFGLNDPVGLVDGVTTPADAPFPTVRISHLVAQTRVVTPGSKGVPDPMVQRPALDDPMVKIGPRAGPLVDVEYDASTGTIAVPPALFDSTEPWRLQYRVGGVPHDLVWTTSHDPEPSIVVPIVGRLPRTAPPTNSGYDIRPPAVAPPPPTPGNFRASRVFTVGVFMDILTGTSPSDTRVDGVANKHVSGPLGSPDASAGDAGVLANYRTLGNCEHLVDGYAEFFVPPLVAGVKQVPLDGALQPGQPAWQTNQSMTESTSVQLVNTGPAGLALRLFNSLASLSDTTLDEPLYQIGFAASDLLPLLTPERPISFIKAAALSLRRPPGPLMFLLAQCALATVNSGGYIVPTGLAVAPYPRVVYGVGTNRRSVNGIELLSSLVTVDKEVNDAVTLDFGVPLALEPTLSTISLATGTDPVLVTAAPTFDLDFRLEPDGGGFTGALDYLEVTVFELLGGALVPIHVYVTTDVTRDPDGTLATPIQIDGSQLATGIDYVLQIRSVRGAPNAVHGDFETVAFPQAMATMFTRVFRPQ